MAKRRAGRFKRFFRRVLPQEFVGDGSPTPQTTTMVDIAAASVLGHWVGQDPYVDLNASQTRKSRYERFELICKHIPPVHTALSIRSKLPFLKDRRGEVPLRIVSKSTRVRDVLDALNDRLNLPLVLPSQLYECLKFGDNFRERIVDLKKGMIVKYRYFEPHTIRVIQDKQKTTIGYYYSGDDKDFMRPAEGKLNPKYVMEPWQMCHFNRTFDTPYGRSELYYSESRAREYQWMVFAAMVGRIFRSLDVRERFVDVSDCDTEDEKIKRLEYFHESENFVAKILDSNNNLKTFSSIPFLPRDLYTPITANSSERVGTKVLPGQQGMSQIKDLEHFREEVLSPLGVPKRLLNLGTETISRAELTEQDKHLVRLALCDQEWALSQILLPMYRMELALQGIDWTRPKNKFQVYMVDLDTGEAKQAAQIERMRAQVFKLLDDTGKWDSEFLKGWLYELTDEEIKKSVSALEALADITEEEKKANENADNKSQS